MPLILVVEQEKRYVERIQEALSPQGWEVVGVDDRASVMRLVADRAADLVVVNAEVDEAAELVSSFSRAAGGPGTVALVPEAGESDEVRAHADEVLEKPFTDQDIRLAVRRCLSAGREAPTEEAAAEAPPPSAERLSSEELFGDVVLELEDAFSLGAAAEEGAAEVAAEPAAEESEQEEPAEEPLEEAPAEEAEVVEVSAEEEIDEALSGIAVEESESEVEPEIEDEADLEEPEPTEDEPAEEEEPIEEELEIATLEEDVAQEAEVEPEEDEPELEAEDEEPEAEEDEPELEAEVEEAGPEEAEPELEEEAAEVAAAEAPKPGKLGLEDRLREAVLAGKAAAAEKESAPVEEIDSGEAADLLLQKALGTLSWAPEAKPAIDEEFAEPAHATEEEVDELVGTVVAEPAEELREEVGEDALDDEAEEDEGPGLDVVDVELRERDEGDYRDRMKLVWAIIVIALLALLAFVVTRRLSEDTVPEQPEVISPATVGEEAAGSTAEESADPEATDVSAEPESDGVEDGGNGGDDAEENGGGA